MSQNRIFLILLLVSIPCHQSGASGEPSRLLEDTRSNESSPAPSPGLNSGPKSLRKSDVGNSADPTVAPSSDSRCSVPAETCHAGEHLTACLHPSKIDSKGIFVLVKNAAEDPLEGKIICSPGNIISEVNLTKQQSKVVYVTAGVCSNITLDAGNVKCTIPMRVPALEGNFFQQFPGATQVTPIHGLYLLLGMVVTIGGVWACCKFGKSERRIEGIPYQELEMGQADSTTANVVEDVEDVEGWDESWDDDWGDEIREVKSPSQRTAGNAASKANGFVSRSSNRTGWEDTWDD